jgi:Na+/phosphate symporter
VFGGRELLLKNRATLQKKLALLQEFFHLTVLQQQALDGGDMQKFNELIEARRKIIDIVDGLDTEIAFREQAYRAGARQADFHDATTEKLIRDVQRVKQNIQECLQQIQKTDRQVMQELEKKHHALVKAMGKMRTARQADALYRKKAQQVRAYFIDKKK